jgi:hypothetical protein
MASKGRQIRAGQMLRYAFGTALLLLSVVAVLSGARWYGVAFVFIPALMFVVGNSRRILRAAVARSDDEIVCRYIPWNESIVYFGGVLIPAIGAAGITSGSDPGFPGWFRYGGIVLVSLSALWIAASLRLWRKSLLCVTPTTLTIRLPAGLRGVAEIRREQVQSIGPKIESIGMGMEALRAEIIYQATGVSDETSRIVLGPQLTVEPANLLNGLLAWKDGANDDPTELMDRIEGILRGHSAARA